MHCKRIVLLILLQSAVCITKAMQKELCHRLIREKIQTFGYTYEMKTCKGTINSKKLVEARKQLISLVKDNSAILDTTSIAFLIDLYSERKRYFLAHNKTKPVFLDDDTFNALYPFIVNKKRIDAWLKKEKELHFLLSLSNPIQMNTLIYEYPILKPEKKSFQNSIEKGINSTIKFINLFKKKEKKYTIFNRSYLIHWLSQAHEYGFLIGDTVYKGIKPLIIHFDQLEMPNALEQTSQSHIEYLKMVFQPQCHHAFELKEISGDLHKRVFIFLCCLKRWESERLKYKVPKTLLQQCILSQLAIYEHAQRVRPFLVEDIQLAKETNDYEGVDEAVKFIYTDFLQWFDKEALR